MEEEQALKILRDQIDELDYQIHDLLNQRADLALKVSEVKINYQGDHAKFHRPQREQAILNRIKAYNKGPLDENQIAAIFDRIIQTCRDLQIENHQKRRL